MFLVYSGTSREENEAADIGSRDPETGGGRGIRTSTISTERYKLVLAADSQNQMRWILSRSTTKPTKWHVRPAKTLPSLIRVFPVRMKKAWIFSYPLSTQRRP